jgi:hypothetical protein
MQTGGMEFNLAHYRNSDSIQNISQPQYRAPIMGMKAPFDRDPFARGTLIAAPRWPFATLAARSTLAIPYVPKGRNGVILGQRFVVRIGDTGAVSRGGAGRLYWHL